MRDLITEYTLNLILEGNNAIYITMNGKEVPYESVQCIDDLRKRLSDAKRTRDMHSRGSELRMCYNGLMKNYRTLIKRHPLCNIVESLDEIDTEGREHAIASWLLSEAVTDGAVTTSMAQGFKNIFKQGAAIVSSTLKDIASGVFGTLGAAIALTTKKGNEFIKGHESRSQKYRSERRAAMSEIEKNLSGPMFLFGLGGAKLTFDAIEGIANTINPKSNEIIDAIAKAIPDGANAIRKKIKEMESSGSNEFRSNDPSFKEMQDQIKKLTDKLNAQPKNESKINTARMLLEIENDSQSSRIVTLDDLNNMLKGLEELENVFDGLKKEQEDKKKSIAAAKNTVDTLLNYHQSTLEKLNSNDKEQIQNIASNYEKMNKDLIEINESLKDTAATFKTVSQSLELQIKELSLISKDQDGKLNTKNLINDLKLNIDQLSAAQEKLSQLLI